MFHEQKLNDIGSYDLDVKESILLIYYPEDDEEELEDTPIELENRAARNGNVWSSIQGQPVRLCLCDIRRREQSGPVQETKGLTVADTFEIIHLDEIYDITICESNRKTRELYDGDSAKQQIVYLVHICGRIIFSIILR